MDVFSQVVERARSQLRVAAVNAGVQLGLFGTLSPGQGTEQTAEQSAGMTPEGFAAALGIRSPHRLEALLEVLALEKILERLPPAFDQADSLVSRGPPRSPRYRTSGPAPTVQPLPPFGWGRLAEVIRTDIPLDEPGVSGRSSATNPSPNDPLERFHTHLCRAGADAAAELMSPLSRTEGGTLLDLGSGAGAYSSAWLSAREDVKAILLDRPAVLRLAGRALAKSGGSGDSGEDGSSEAGVVGAARSNESPSAARFELMSADLLDSEMPWPRARVVLLANLLHLYGPEESQELVLRAARAACPGGLVVIKDLLLDSDPLSSTAGIFFSLNMALFTERGRAHRREALLQLLERAGLCEIRSFLLQSAPDAVVALGRRPLAEGQDQGQDR